MSRRVRHASQVKASASMRQSHVARPFARAWKPLKLLLVTVAVAISLAASVSNAQLINQEFALKARLLAIIGDFFTWPAADAATPQKPFTIGIIGKDPFDHVGGNHLDDNIARRRLRENRAIRVLRFDSARDYQTCHVLFISQFATAQSVETTLNARLAAVSKALEGKSVLLITDSPGRAQQGAIVNMVIRGNNVAFEVNPVAANRHQLKTHPSLLRAATIVADPVNPQPQGQ